MIHDFYLFTTILVLLLIHTTLLTTEAVRKIITSC